MNHLKSLSGIEFKNSALITNFWPCPQLMAKLLTKQWRFDNAQWEKWHCSHILTIIKSTSVQVFLAVSLQNQSLLEGVYHVDFDKLRELYLGNNSISSVEFMSTLYVPCLQRLALNNNQIITLQSLRKGCFRELNFITIANNLINELESLCQINCKLISSIHLQVVKTNRVQSQSKEWIVKMETSGITKIFEKSQNRIQRSLEFNKARQKKFIRLPR